MNGTNCVIKLEKFTETISSSLKEEGKYSCRKENSVDSSVGETSSDLSNSDSEDLPQSLDDVLRAAGKPTILKNSNILNTSINTNSGGKKVKKCLYKDDENKENEAPLSFLSSPRRPSRLRNQESPRLNNSLDTKSKENKTPNSSKTPKSLKKVSPEKSINSRIEERTPSKYLLRTPQKSTPTNLQHRTPENQKRASQITLNDNTSALSMPTKSPFRKLEMEFTASLSPKSPLKNISTEAVRRSPRKHQSSSLYLINSPLRKLNLNMELCSDPVRAKLISAVRQSLASTSDQTLVGRETEITKITKFLSSSKTSGEKRSMYISGAPGTGKTAALTQILDKNNVGKAKSEVVWVNCMGLHTSTAVYGRIATQLSLPPQPTELKTIRAIEKCLCTRLVFTAFP